MKKYLVMMVAVLTALAIAVPAFAALEVKYGGLFRTRIQSNDNFTDGSDDTDDNQNYFDQRLRWFMNFIASENLQLVTGFEVDTLWGDSRRTVFPATVTNGVGGPKVLTGHRDTVSIEVKHAYIDFTIPQTELRAKAGLQPVALMRGWIVDEDFTGILASTKFDPISIVLGYISEINDDVTTEDENVDDFFGAIGYAQGPFKADLAVFYQYAHDQAEAQANVINPRTVSLANPATAFLPVGNSLYGDDNNLVDIGLNLAYKHEWFDVFLMYVQNLGSFDDNGVGRNGKSVDFGGFMVEGGGNIYWGDFTFTLGGFVTSGEKTDDTTGNIRIDGGTLQSFQYPIGRSHYWSEIMGLGTLDTAINSGGTAQAADPPPANRGNYQAADSPSNLWMVNLGAAWQLPWKFLDGTKLTANYYYIGTYEAVTAGPRGADGTFELDDSIGHEIDFYIDQGIVDKLVLRFVGAYLFAEDALTRGDDDDDIYEIGARLQWAF
jgi:hypothetical protein